MAVTGQEAARPAAGPGDWLDESALLTEERNRRDDAKGEGVRPQLTSYIRVM